MNYEPLTYTCNRCGTSTTMSSSIVKKNTLDPYFYMGGFTECAGCGVVSDEDCVIVGSGVTLSEYQQRLKENKSVMYHAIRWGIYAMFALVGCGLGPLIKQMNTGSFDFPADPIWGMVMGLCAAFFVGKYIRLAICSLRLDEI